MLDDYLARIDWPVAVRGAGNGFGILVIAGLLATTLLTMGKSWAWIVILVGWPLGFILAAWRSGKAPSPPLTGGAAAFFAYTLTLPLIYMSDKGFNLAGITGTVVVGTCIGAATGWFMGRRAAPASPGPRPGRR